MGGIITANQSPLAFTNVSFFQKGRARTRCPHCQCAANCRSSREIAITNRELYYECTNLFCGHAWKSSEIYDHGLRPSAIPNPSVDLKMRQPTRAEVLELMRDRDPDQPELFDAPPLEIKPGEDPDSGCG